MQTTATVAAASNGNGGRSDIGAAGADELSGYALGRRSARGGSAAAGTDDHSTPSLDVDGGGNAMVGGASGVAGGAAWWTEADGRLSIADGGTLSSTGRACTDGFRGFAFRFSSSRLRSSAKRRPQHRIESI